MRKLLLSLPILLLSCALAFCGEFTTTSTPISPSGVRAAIDLPPQMHQQNSAGTDGLGLCVFTSSEVAGWGWQYNEALHGFEVWMERQEGGGFPSKFDSMLEAYCKERGIPVPPYIQHVGGDEEFLALALKTRRAPCVTYAGMDGFYRGDIAHMVVLGNLSDSDSCILDNNRPGKWVWMDKSDFSYRWHLNTWGKGWAIVFLTEPPPPDEKATPAPKPTPAPNKPKPKPRRPWLPLFPRWHKVTLYDGGVLWQLYDKNTLLGVWAKDGWHEALTSDGWSVNPQGHPPLPRPDQPQNQYWTNGGTEVSADYFPDDSGKDYLTAIVASEAEKAKLLSDIARSPGLGDKLGQTHFNVFLSSWWAAKRVSHAITLQDPSGKPIFTGNTSDVPGLLAALKSKEPIVPAPSPSPAPPPPPPVTMSSELFWGSVGAISLLGVQYARRR